MQTARAAVAPGVPAYLVTRPAVGSRGVDRSELRAKLSQAIGEYRVGVLLAPAGFGKTTALSAWAEQVDHPVSWLSLTAADHHPEHLTRGLAAAVAELDAASGSGPRVLVIEDVHLAGETAATAVLKPLVERPPVGVRLLLSGRSDPGLGLPRLLADGDMVLLGADELALSDAEIGDLGVAIGREVSAERASALHKLTRGWPVAVRFALMSAGSGRPAIEVTPSSQIPHLPEYLVESVLGQLPCDLAEFVVEACVCDWLTADLVRDLFERTDAATLLERVVASGLPLERRESPGTDPVYRWHPLMAVSGRTLLQRRDPSHLRELERRAAGALASLDPAEAASHALAGGDAALASALLRAHWLAAILRGDSGPIAELCAQLPAPHSDNPEILAIRAACLRNAGDAERAAELDGRARRLIGPDTEPRVLDLTLSLARLFVIDSGAELASEAARATHLLAELTEISGPPRACALLLLGWTELRLRKARVAIPLLREADQLCRAEGLADLADRARANEAFGLAFIGDFEGASARMAAVSPDAEAAGWRRADGAIEWFTLGWVRYYSGDAAGAVAACRQAAERGGGLISYADLARCWLVNAAVDTGDSDAVQRSLTMLDLVADRTLQGLPFDVYRAVALAGADLLAGDAASARCRLDAVMTGDAQLPAANGLAAELYWRLGDFDKAQHLAALVLGEVPAYLQASGVVLTALAAASSGNSELAHERLESALAMSAPQELLRPFLLRDPSLGGLLATHSSWGTRYEELVATCLTRRAERGTTAIEPLTVREREILSQPSTTRSIAEIAAALFISPNTLKTHLKSIYRKLGARNRRDAVGALRADSVHVGLQQYQHEPKR